MFKKTLLDTGYFIDNDCLAEYVQLTAEPSADDGYKENYHILPQQYFKLINKPCDNSADNLVKLSYANHCKAHYLLALCTTGALHKGSVRTLNLMTNSSRAKFSKLSVEEQKVLKVYSDCNDLFWSTKEIELLQIHYPTLGTSCIKFLPNRTKKAIKGYARQLGLHYDFVQSNKRRYTAEEDQFLVENYQKYGVNFCANSLNRSVASIKSRAAKVLNITRPAVKPWSVEEVEILREFYSTLGPTGVVDKLPLRKPSDIRKKACRLGIRFAGKGDF